MAQYLDTSALVKLVVAESETAALRRWIASEERDLVSCDLARTELFRAARGRSPDRMVRVREILDSLTIMTVSTAIFEDAGRLDPIGLRSLDAIHLAAAIDLGDDLEGLVTYDRRLADAAEMHGMLVLAPE